MNYVFYNVSNIYHRCDRSNRMSDRTIVNTHLILVKYNLSNDNSYNKYWCNTDNVKIFKGGWETDCNT